MILTLTSTCRKKICSPLTRCNFWVEDRDLRGMIRKDQAACGVWTRIDPESESFDFLLSVFQCSPPPHEVSDPPMLGVWERGGRLFPGLSECRSRLPAGGAVSRSCRSAGGAGQQVGACSNSACHTGAESQSLVLAIESGS